MQKFLASFIISLYVIILLLTLSFISITFSYPIKYQSYINKASVEFNIPTNLIYSLINVESSFKPTAQSNAGAIGLTQLMPTTAQYICTKNNIDYSSINLYNPQHNIYIGCMYLRYLLNRFNNIYTALSAYNAGETNVRNWLSNPNYSNNKITLKYIPFNETRNYIKKIKFNQKIYINLYKLK